mmetsp:Transcript_26243/g.87942  ORF Transcript_26243/g.87942 Transcript_26243/m.87942 type:complete len:157 (-) Transcript_26243:483-953(-)
MRAGGRPRPADVHGRRPRGPPPKPARDAFLAVAFTAHDLTKPGDWQFVVGEARPGDGTGVLSVARFGGAHVPEGEFLRRCCMCLVHEVGHLLGLAHCVWSGCVMNGSNHLEESCRGPSHCAQPICARWETLCSAVWGPSILRIARRPCCAASAPRD